MLDLLEYTSVDYKLLKNPRVQGFVCVIGGDDYATGDQVVIDVEDTQEEISE